MIEPARMFCFYYEKEIPLHNNTVGAEFMPEPIGFYPNKRINYGI